jgi:hypothetical protein
MLNFKTEQRKYTRKFTLMQSTFNKYWTMGWLHKIHRDKLDSEWDHDEPAEIFFWVDCVEYERYCRYLEHFFDHRNRTWKHG